MEDWFATAGLSDALDPSRIEITRSLNHRSVSAPAAVELPTILLHMLGIPALDVAAAASAEETHNDVEISLVLDVPGSIADHSRLTNLQSASGDFVDLVTARMADAPGLTTIGVVPCSMTVSLGPEVAALYDVVPPSTEPLHGYSNCVLLDDDDFTSTALPPTRELKQYPHFDSDDGPGRGRAYLGKAPGRISTPLCQSSTVDEPGVNPRG